MIACFDLATEVGVAWGEPGHKPRLATWSLASHNRPDRYLTLAKLTQTFLTKERIERVFYEAPMQLGPMFHRGSNRNVILMLYGTAAVIELSAAWARIEVGTWEVQTARKAVVGRGTWPKGKDAAKQACFEFCRMIGHRPADFNQADALIGFLYESALLNPRIAHLSAPLFRN